MTDRTHPDSGRIITSSDVIADLQDRIAELEAQIEALSGVQALSAAPASPWSRALEIRMAQGWKLRGDRIPVLYTDTINGECVGRDDLWLCTTEALAASPTPPAEQPVGRDEDEALDLLAILFDAWEDGTPCYEEPESSDGYLGHAFRLDGNVFHRCADLLNRRRSKTDTPTAEHPATTEAVTPEGGATTEAALGAEQAAPKAAPAEQNTVPAEWLEQAYREAWAACRDAETIGEEAEDWAFGNSTANSRMIDAQQAAPQQEAQPTEIPQVIERMATDRYKVVPSHESMFHRWAVVAGSGTQQLYLGREVECQNMARKFAGAFLDGAFFAMQQPAPKQEAQEPVAWQGVHDQTDLYYTKPLQADVRPLYAAPQPAPATRQAANYPPLPTAIGFAHFFEGELINAHSPRFQAEFNEEGEFDDHNVELFTADQMRAYVDATHTLRASHGQAPATAQADSVPAVEREQERIAFKDAHRHLDLDEVPDAWGRPMFKHSHVEASWLGWIARASRGKAPAVESVPVLPDFDTVEQHIYGACRRYITQDMLEPIHNLIRDAIDADRTARASAESAERDAERYRWLRAPRLAAGQGSITVELDDRANGDFSRSIFLADLDSAIDAAIAAQGGSK